MVRRAVWVRYLGALAVAALLVIGGLAAGRAPAVSAQAMMWFDPVTGLYYNFAATSTAVPVEVPLSYTNPITVSAAQPNIYVAPAVSYVAPTVTYVAPTVTYSSTIPSVAVSGAISYVSPGGNYCAAPDGAQIWVPAGTDPASLGC